MQPPEDAWGDDERIDEWFSMLKAEREAKAGRHGGSGEALEEVPQTQNEYARELLRGR